MIVLLLQYMCIGRLSHMCIYIERERVAGAWHKNEVDGFNVPKGVLFLYTYHVVECEIV